MDGIGLLEGMLRRDGVGDEVDVVGLEGVGCLFDGYSFECLSFRFVKKGGWTAGYSYSYV